MFAVTALLGAAAVTLFVFQVMLVVSDREASPSGGDAWNEARDGTIETVSSAGDIAVGGVRLIGSAAGILSLPMLVLLGALIVATAAGVGIANFGDELSGAFDSAFTEVWPPFYRGVILGIADPVLSLWNIIVPVANSLNGTWRIFQTNLISQAIDCEPVDWGDAALKLRDVVLASLNSIISWILGLAGDDFDLYNPLVSLQIAIADLGPIFGCWCEAIGIPMDIAVGAVTSHELAAVLDRTLNLPINVVKDVVGSFLAYAVAFGKALFAGKDFFESLGDYYWEPNRMPSVERTLRTTGQLIARIFDWLDDLVLVIAQTLFSLTDSEVPRFFGIFGNYAESIVLDANVLADSWGVSYVGPFGLEKGLRRLALLGTRYDNATWNRSRGVAIRTESLLTDAFVKAYNASLLSETFFQTIAFPISKLNDSTAADTAVVLLNYTGCMSHEVLDVVTALTEIVARLWVAAFHERIVGGEYGEYLRNPPFNDALHESIDSAKRFGECAAGFYTEIDDELGQLVNETGHVIRAVIEPFIALHENWGNRTGYFKGALFSGLVDDVFFEMDAWAIAAGDFVRQFAFAGGLGTSTIDPDVECRTRDVHLEQSPAGHTVPGGATQIDQGDWDAFYPWYVDPFCCLGGAVEEFFRLFFGVFEGLTRAIVAFAQEATFADGFVRTFRSGGPLDLRAEFLPMIDFLMRDLFRFSCIKFGIARVIGENILNLGAFAPACNNGTDTVWEYVVEVVTGVVRVPIRFVGGGFSEIFSWIVVAVDTSASCDADCWCERLKALYSTTIGELVDWIADVMHLFACLIGEALSTSLTGLEGFASNFRSALGSQGTVATGDLFCAIVDFFATIWDLFQCWGNGGGFVQCILDTVLSGLADLVDAIVDCIGGFLTEIWDTIKCIADRIWAWVQKFFSEITCIFTNPLEDCPRLSTYLEACAFTVPAVCSGGGLSFTTGEVGITLPRPIEFPLAGKSKQKISSAYGGFGGSPGASAAFGSSAGCLGDVDNDGVPDVAIGAPGTGEGSLWMLFLKSDGSVASEQEIGSGVGGFGGNISAGDEFGAAVAGVGDFDGDAIVDALVGAPGTSADAGTAWLLLMAGDGTVSSEQEIAPTGLSAGDRFGASVAGIGDLDGDGVIDFAVGAPGSDSVWILLANANATVKTQIEIGQGLGGFGGSISAGSEFGNAIAAVGDLDGDNVTDLAVGAWRDPDGGVDAGAVWIMFMTANGTVKAEQKIGALDPGGMLDVIGVADRFGSSIAPLGDFDGNGALDLIVGAVNDDNLAINAGAIHLVYLTSTGVPSGSAVIHGLNGGLHLDLARDDFFGAAVAVVGDLDGDGHVDAIVGAPGDDDNATASGSAYAIFLTYPEPRIAGDLVIDERFVGPGGEFGQVLLSSGEMFGASVAGIGDMDGNGQPDFAVGSPYPGAFGRVRFFFTDATGSGTFVTDLLLPGVPSRFGAAIANVGDFDGDGKIDMLVGAPGDPANASATGSAYLYLLDNGTAPTTGATSQEIGTGVGGFSGSLTAGGDFGAAVATLGDLDGDGVIDFAIGEPGRADGGGVWIVFMYANSTVKNQTLLSNLTGGASSGDLFGSALVALADVDGDGVVDLAVGAPGDDDGGTDRGAVWILFLATDGSATSTQKISSTQGEFTGPLFDGDRFGSALATDGNSDGIGSTDLVVGAPGSGDDEYDRGGLWFLYLRVDGTTHRRRRLDVFEESFLGDLGPTDLFGSSAAYVGSLGGFSDLIVGSPGRDEVFSPDAGGAWIVSLLNQVFSNYVDSHLEIGDATGGFGGTLANNDAFGFSVAGIGDLDGDGEADAIVGAPGDGDGGIGNGAIWVLFLNGNGTLKSEQKISETAGGFGGSLGSGAFGWSAASMGDLDGDSNVDLIVGAPNSAGGGSLRGAVWIVFLFPNGTASGEQKIDDVTGGFGGTLANGDAFGTGVASIGDLDGDNVTDAAVGASGDSSDAGAVWILFMNANGTVKSEQKIAPLAGLSAGDGFGTAVAGIGDLDGDGNPDIAVGAPGTGLAKGSLWILFLHANGTIKAEQRIGENFGGFEGTLSPFGRFGASVALLYDLGTDGIEDLAVGGFLDDDGGTDRGAIWLLHMDADGTVKATTALDADDSCPSKRSILKISATADSFTGVLADGDHFGASIALIGDFDGDAIPDVAVGAPNADGGGSNRGAVWALFLIDKALEAPAAMAPPPPALPSASIRRLARAAPRHRHPEPQRKRRATSSISSSLSTSPVYSMGTTTTGIGLPEVITFADIERWCAVEGSHLASLNEAVSINENSTQIPSDQKEINRRLLNASLYEMSMSYSGCLASASVAKMVDLSIGFASRNETIVDPKTFYDPIRFIYFASRLAIAAPAALQYHLERVEADPALMNPDAFVGYLAAEYNATDALTVRLGAFFERMLRAARLLVDRRTPNLLGYAINSIGQLFYPQLAPVPAARFEVVYGAAPLHPEGWQSPRWKEFWTRYSTGLLEGYSTWHRAAGVEDRTWAIEYATSLPQTFARRLEWNRAGRVPSDEPYPRGRLAQRARYQNLLDHETAPRYAWESNETAAARRLYAKAKRETKYPSLSGAGFVGKHQDLISSDFVCPVGVPGQDYNCTDRICWSADGVVVGACNTRSNFFGRPVCTCDYDSIGGACCTDSSCTDVASADLCDALDGAFAPNVSCPAAVTCAAARGACCDPDGTCSVVSTAGRCEDLGGTFLAGSICAACSDASLIVGACCDAGACSMTTEIACTGTWNDKRNCSSRALADECRACGAPPCISCDIVFATVNDIVDLWIMNLELINSSASTGACCYGSDPTNRSCELNARSTCDRERPDSTWFWGEQCSYCQTPFAFALATPPRTVRPMIFQRDLESIVLGAFQRIVDVAIGLGGRIFPSIEGATFDVDVFVENVAYFFFSNDSEDPGSWRFWFDFLFLCDVFDHLFPDVGPKGLGIVRGLFWATIGMTVVYAVLSRCWRFLGGLLSGVILLWIWLMLVLVIAYFYSPACYGTFFNAPKYIFRARRGKAQPQAVAAPVAGAGAGVPVAGGRIGKLADKAAAGMTKLKGMMASAARNIMTFMFSVPMLPVQLGQDVRDEILAVADVDCLPFCDVACPRESGKWPCAWMTDEDREAGIACLDERDCCAVAECDEDRVFPNCAAEPFEFKSSTREIAYWLRVWAPKTNCFLLHSDFFLFSWLRGIPEVSARIDFPGDECAPPDFDDEDKRWRHCARKNVLLLAPWAIVLILAYVFIWGLIVLLWITFKALLKLGRRVTTFSTAASASAIRATARPEEEGPPPARGGVTRRAARSEGAVLGHARSRPPARKDE